MTNNFLWSLLTHYIIFVNGVTMSQAVDLYNYRSIFGGQLTYGSVVAAWHMTNALWYVYNGDILPCDLIADGAII